MRANRTSWAGTSPSISIQDLIFSFIIDDNEDRNVATEGVSIYLLHTDYTSGSMYLKLGGLMGEIFPRIDPDQYLKCTTIDEKC